jgi:hypothetical protein
MKRPAATIGGKLAFPGVPEKKADAFGVNNFQIYTDIRAEAWRVSLPVNLTVSMFCLCDCAPISFSLHVRAYEVVCLRVCVCVFFLVCVWFLGVCSDRIESK